MLMRTSECPLWYLTYRTEEQEIMGLTRALLLVLSRNLSCGVRRHDARNQRWTAK